MKKLVSLIILPFLFVACDDLDGTFEAFQNLEFKDRKNNTVTVSEGSYEAKIKFNSKKKMTLQLDRESGETKIEFRIPKDIEFGENETVSLTAAQVNQNYDVDVTDENSVSVSGLQQGSESCNYRVPRRVCRRRPNGQMTCWTEWINVWGRRYVSYRVEVKTGLKTIEILSPGEPVALGEFIAPYEKSKTLYESVGPCRGHGPYPF